jgi:hypothetical protein
MPCFRADQFSYFGNLKEEMRISVETVILNTRLCFVVLWNLVSDSIGFSVTRKSAS